MSKTYNLWTAGCQMNVDDSQRVGSELEKLGYIYSDSYREADVVVVNTCVVRQSAEDKATGFLWTLKPYKENNPNKVIALMGCMVGVKGGKKLVKTFPHVDVFMSPSETAPLVDFLISRDEEKAALEERYKLQDEELSFVLPRHQQNNLVATYVTIIRGCSHVCSYCIIPSRRGIEHSRPVGEIVGEIRSMVAQGVKEVTLLGQIVDRYGYDVPAGPCLPDLLRVINDIEGLARIRFLTSHPNYMTDDLLDAMVELPKVCEHVEVPNQAGDDEVLFNMKREYNITEYANLIKRIRARMPKVSIATDIIVGFPGETEAQFQRTLGTLAQLKLDVCHVAMYSPRPGTVSAKILPDDVSADEKKRRLQAVNDLQEQIVTEINASLLGEMVEVLVEEKQKGRWRGRTRTNKLVFFEDDSQDWRGKLAQVEVTWTGPWSLRGTLPGQQPLNMSHESMILPLIH
ncbi:tRNA (N6-isopentenyl adenosine(37)-C2)-methylthiotransferase MiaB [Anaerolineales bacterium HSG24]|nr:tRNA (N6-isopentenyl adenosine(37)-C2)-methylthiotransferase MiaB [Anaerolineales bacterium HSG24]